MNRFKALLIALVVFLAFFYPMSYMVEYFASKPSATQRYVERNAARSAFLTDMALRGSCKKTSFVYTGGDSVRGVWTCADGHVELGYEE